MNPLSVHRWWILFSLVDFTRFHFVFTNIWFSSSQSFSPFLFFEFFIFFKDAKWYGTLKVTHTFMKKETYFYRLGCENYHENDGKTSAKVQAEKEREKTVGRRYIWIGKFEYGDRCECFIKWNVYKKSNKKKTRWQYHWKYLYVYLYTTNFFILFKIPNVVVVIHIFFSCMVYWFAIFMNPFLFSFASWEYVNYDFSRTFFEHILGR